jgi:hypothetical protein
MLTVGLEALLVRERVPLAAPVACTKTRDIVLLRGAPLNLLLLDAVVRYDILSASQHPVSRDLHTSRRST